MARNIVLCKSLLINLESYNLILSHSKTVLFICFYLRFEAIRDPTNITTTNEDTVLAATMGPIAVFNCVPGNPVLDGVAVSVAEASSEPGSVESGPELFAVGLGEGF